MIKGKGKINLTVIAIAFYVLIARSGKKTEQNNACQNYDSNCCDCRLTEDINNVIKDAPGMVGVAFINCTDTLLINNGVHYPMMSVFKLHESIAVCRQIENRNCRLDSVINVSSEEIDTETWSPMLKEYDANGFEITIGELIRYALVSSDNNASNILFNRIISPMETDKLIRSIAPDKNFSIKYSEGEMKRNHSLAYSNYSSPLSAALLLWKLFKGTILTDENQEFIKRALCEVTTGRDRLGGPIRDEGEILFAHKTGSGYRNDRGELAAHNDVGYFMLPDGRDYSLAVMIRDFDGSEEEASAIMASISEIVYNHVLNSSSSASNTK